MAKTSVEIELLMRDSTRRGMQSAESNIKDFQRMTEAVIKRLEGEIARMQKQLSKGIDMGDYVKESAKIEALTEEVEKLKRVIEELEAAKKKTNSVPLTPEDPVVTKRKFDGLGMSFQQIARELPSLAMGPQMFFLAISNNLPIFTDQLAIARKEYEALTASGQKATPVWKQVLRSMFSWQTAMMVLISLSIVYAKDMADWCKRLVRTKNAIQDVVSAEEALNLARKKGIENSAKEKSKLDVLYKAATDLHRSTQERIKAIKQLQSIYPKIFSSYTNEEIMLGKACAAYETLRKQIIATVQAKAYEDKITDFESKKYGALVKRQNQYVTYLKSIEKQNAAINEYKQREKVGFGTATAKLEAKDKVIRAGEEVKRAKQDWMDLIGVTKAYDKAIASIATKININDLYADYEGGDDKTDVTTLINAIADARLSAQQKLEAARLAVMADGYEKRKRLARKELDETLADIDKSERDQLKKLDDAKKKGVTISPVQYTQVKDTAKDQRTEAARKYANDIWQIEKEGIEKQRKLSDAEKQSWIDYNKEYGTYQEKRLAIARDYVSKLSGVNTGGERATFKKEMEKQLEELDFDQFKGSIDFSKVFGSLDNLSTESLERLRDKLGKFIQEASKKLSPENTKELSDAFIRIDFKISERDPFRELKSSISEYKSAIRELEKAESDLAKVQSGQSVAATTRYDAATGKIVTTLLAQEEVERRLRTAEDKRAASLSKMNKSLHEGVDRAREYLDAATALTGALEDFGVSVPEEINGALDGFGQTLDSLASIDVTKPMSIVTGAIGAVGGLGKGILSLFGSAKELSQETIDQYNNYIGVIDDLIAKQQELIRSTAGSSVVVFSREAEEMIRKQMEASRQIGQDYFNSGASWRSSSHGVKQMDVIKRYRAELNGIGIDISRWGKRGTELFDLPARQLAELQKQLPKLWAQLDESTRTYLQAIIDGDEKLNEIMDQRNQSLTGITFDEARSSLKSLLLDADSTMADVADSFEDYMRQAIVNTIIDDTLRSQIKTWYEQFADAMDDGTLSGDEKKKLQELYQSIYQDAADMRDSVFDAAGISPETDKQSQSGRPGTVTALTEETGSELAGIGRNIQDHVVSLDKKFTAVSDTLFAVSGTLTKIEDNTRRSAEGIEEIVRDGLKMK
ncbi:rhoptry family protein [Bacteroides hominis]|uniref:hypothetical protein n=1 Tax=Bacteroides hominis TaxID=2763023 RepID=UPI002061EF4C|nr:hypothetical protein [Bacteroides hominis (ex Liu et al. 2022)]MDV6195465.1 hypothetical protein [Bacteroides hominis (ex Liu et al. 2022)]DAI45811.1 MAG TPA: tail tape measure protein [Caudoviricetes sp.]